MKIITNKKFFDDAERKRFKIWLIQNSTMQEEVAKKLNVSETYISLVLTGKRAATDKFLKGLEKLGYKVGF